MLGLAGPAIGGSVNQDSRLARAHHAGKEWSPNNILPRTAVEDFSWRAENFPFVYPVSAIISSMVGREATDQERMMSEFESELLAFLETGDQEGFLEKWRSANTPFPNRIAMLNFLHMDMVHAKDREGLGLLDVMMPSLGDLSDEEWLNLLKWAIKNDLPRQIDFILALPSANMKLLAGDALLVVMAAESSSHGWSRLHGMGVDVAQASPVTTQNSLHYAAHGGNLEAVEKIVELGVFAVDCRDHMGVTPLMLASAAGKADVVRFLLSHGASASEVNCHKNNALHYLLVGDYGLKSEEMLAPLLVLLHAGANPFLEDDQGRSALDVCNDEMVARTILSFHRGSGLGIALPESAAPAAISI